MLRTRVAHQLRYRRAVVVRAEPLSAGMRRIILGGEELAGFVSLGFDDHVKLFFPDASGILPTPTVDTGVRFPENGPRPEGRDFTPRRFDAAALELTVDFGLHGSGPATTWARTAAPGAIIGIGGPRGSEVLSSEIAWHLLAGDETALPAIARRLDECPAHIRILAAIEVENESERVALPRRERAEVTWVYRQTSGAAGLDEAVRTMTIPEGPGLAWVAGEASMARRLRAHLLHERGLNPQQVKAAAYWRIGGPGKHEVLTD